MLYGFDDVVGRTAPLLERLSDLWEQARKNPTATVVDEDQIGTEVALVLRAFDKAFAGMN
jgi:hypothetical protein